MFRERPAPTPSDVMESTPIHCKGETIRDRSSRLSTILPYPSAAPNTGATIAGKPMGPPAVIPRDRRQTFAPKETQNRFAAELDGFEVHSLGRTTFQPEDLSNTYECSARRETFVKLGSNADSWTPQRMTEERVVRRTWRSDENSLLPGLQPQFAQPDLMEESELEQGDHDGSFQLGSFALSPPREKAEVPVAAVTEKATVTMAPQGTTADVPPLIVVEACKDEPLNLIVNSKGRQPSVYQPEVSDIR